MPKFAMRFATALKVVVMVVVTVEYSPSPALATFRECSVNISNAISVADGGNTLRVDCMKGSKHRHIFTPQILPPGDHYYGWKFVPDIWGQTKYDCDFTWSGCTRRVRVWEDFDWLIGTITDKATERLCTHCVWRVTKEGIFLMTGGRHAGNYGGWCN